MTDHDELHAITARSAVLGPDITECRDCTARRDARWAAETGLRLEGKVRRQGVALVAEQERCLALECQRDALKAAVLRYHEWYYAQKRIAISVQAERDRARATAVRLEQELAEALRVVERLARALREANETEAALLNSDLGQTLSRVIGERDRMEQELAECRRVLAKALRYQEHCPVCHGHYWLHVDDCEAVAVLSTTPAAEPDHARCPTCGQPVRIVGRTTLHYEPVSLPAETVRQTEEMT